MCFIVNHEHQNGISNKHKNGVSHRHSITWIAHVMQFVRMFLRSLHVPSDPRNVVASFATHRKMCVRQVRMQHLDMPTAGFCTPTKCNSRFKSGFIRMLNDKDFDLNAEEIVSVDAVLDCIKENRGNVNFKHHLGPQTGEYYGDVTSTLSKFMISKRCLTNYWKPSTTYAF